MHDARVRVEARKIARILMMTAASCIALLLFLGGIQIIADIQSPIVGKLNLTLLGAAFTFQGAALIAGVVWYSAGGRWGDHDGV
jgi:hypothetical protein